MEFEFETWDGSTKTGILNPVCVEGCVIVIEVAVAERPVWQFFFTLTDEDESWVEWFAFCLIDYLEVAY